MVRMPCLFSLPTVTRSRDQSFTRNVVFLPFHSSDFHTDEKGCCYCGWKLAVWPMGSGGKERRCQKVLKLPESWDQEEAVLLLSKWWRNYEAIEKELLTMLHAGRSNSKKESKKATKNKMPILPTDSSPQHNYALRICSPAALPPKFPSQYDANHSVSPLILGNREFSSRARENCPWP